MLDTVTMDRTRARTSEGGEGQRECERVLGIEIVSQRPFGKEPPL